MGDPAIKKRIAVGGSSPDDGSDPAAISLSLVCVMGECHAHEGMLLYGGCQ
jgi:hypothetical protein